MEEKRIEVVEIAISELKEMEGNPRKCKGAQKKELQKSLEMFGDFSVIVIDDKHRIISGHQRISVLKEMYGEEHKVFCKMLCGYSEPELRAINIKANTHAGEFDLDKLAAWTADLQIDLSLDLKATNQSNEKKISAMEPIRYEKYNFVTIVCRNEIDYLNLTRILGLEGKKVKVGENKSGDRKINARAIWYDKLPVNLIPKEDNK